MCVPFKVCYVEPDVKHSLLPLVYVRVDGILGVFILSCVLYGICWDEIRTG